jgi:Repeat of unknown function (DUF5648)
MREFFKLFVAIAVFAAFFFVAPSRAEFRFYNYTVKFAPSTPARIEAKAYEPIEFTIIGNRQELSALYLPPPLDPRIQYIQQPTQEIAAEYMNQDMTATTATVPPATVSTLRVPGLVAGKYRIRLMYPKGEVFDEREVFVSPSGTPVVVESTGSNGPNAFRLSWFASSATAVPQTTAPFAGVTDRRRFGAWMADGIADNKAPSESVPLYWFTFATGGTTMHYYTVDSALRSVLKSLGWQEQGPFVNVLRDVGGTCPAGGEPVYRAYRPAKAGMWAATHRYTPDPSAYREWVRSGNWLGEGVAFCGRVITEAIAETLSANN